MNEFSKYSIFDAPYPKSHHAIGRVKLIFSQELLSQSANNIYDMLVNSTVVKVIAARENKWNDTYEMLVENDKLPRVDEGAEAPVWCFNYSRSSDNYYISPQEMGYPRIYISEL